jgi:hypothetical protein
MQIYTLIPPGSIYGSVVKVTNTVQPKLRYAVSRYSNKRNNVPLLLTGRRQDTNNVRANNALNIVSFEMGECEVGFRFSAEDVYLVAALVSKICTRHVVEDEARETPTVVYANLYPVHEETTPQAFAAPTVSCTQVAS